MGQFLQQILPYLVPVLIVVFSVGARVMKWASEKQAERQMIQRRERARVEALRTGKPIEDPGTVDLSAREAAAQSKAAGQARLEALREQRIAQLRKIREQRLGGASTQQSQRSTPQPQSSSPDPIARPAPGRSTPRQRAQQADPRREALAAAQRRKANAEEMALQEKLRQMELAKKRAELAEQNAASRAEKESVAPSEGQSRLSSIRVNPLLNVHVGKLHSDHADDPIESSFRNISASSSGKQIRSVLSNRSAVRHAIIMNELLSKPIALRDGSSEI